MKLTIRARVIAQAALITSLVTLAVVISARQHFDGGGFLFLLVWIFGMFAVSYNATLLRRLRRERALAGNGPYVGKRRARI